MCSLLENNTERMIVKYCTRMTVSTMSFLIYTNPDNGSHVKLFRNKLYFTNSSIVLGNNPEGIKYVVQSSQSSPRDKYE